MPGRTGPVLVSQVILAKNAETMTLTSQILELSWLSCRLSKKKTEDKPFDCLDQDPDPLWPYGPLYVPPFGLHIFSGHAQAHSS